MVPDAHPRDVPMMRDGAHSWLMDTTDLAEPPTLRPDPEPEAPPSNALGRFPASAEAATEPIIESVS